MLTVHFYEPPPAKKVGGLELAIRTLEKFLLSAGIHVRINPTPKDLTKTKGPQIVHFHGLWELEFIKVSMLCRRLRIPYVVSPHGMLEPWALRQKRWEKTPWFWMFERRHLSGAARLLTTSDGEGINVAKLFPNSQCLILPLGMAADYKEDYLAARQELV